MNVPPSKSHTLRAILFAALAKGVSRIEEALPSPDTQAMIGAVRQLGAEVTEEGSVLVIRGGKWQVPEDVIQCGNSGIVLRFIGALAGLLPGYTVLTGDASIRERRPAKPLIDGLRQLGAFAESAKGNGFAPLIIRGPIKGGRAVIDGEDSQPVSGLLIAGAFAAAPVELEVRNPGEKPWVDLTLDWLRRLGIPFEREGYEKYRLQGGACIEGFSYRVPGDFSSAAFPIAAALITDTEVTLTNLDREDAQGDKALLGVLQEMGARLIIDEKSITVQKGSRLRGVRVDINGFIDALPILAVLGCFAEGKTEIVNGAIARKKESDRIAAMASELKKMGAQVEERPDGLVIHSSTLRSASLESYNDHRIAMSLAVAALRAPSKIAGVECIEKTYPNFWDMLHEFHSVRV
ncbi:MAG: 3-phosphoshikimate 1-carboxyvinyltransferase [Verrucomicrobiota bacterium]|nr:3-phosphoshikimate 1-carboxyvinyltransferase [Verrucomicrobiota bacterium]